VKSLDGTPVDFLVWIASVIVAIHVAPVTGRDVAASELGR
jgi:hypothetical protein